MKMEGGCSRWRWKQAERQKVQDALWSPAWAEQRVRAESYELLGSKLLWEKELLVDLSWLKTWMLVFWDDSHSEPVTMIIWCHVALCSPGDFNPVWPLLVPCLSPAPCYMCPVPELLTASGHGNRWRGLSCSMPYPIRITELASLLSPASFIQAAMCSPWEDSLSLYSRKVRLGGVLSNNNTMQS